MLGNLPNSFAYPGSYVRWLSGPMDCGRPAYFNSLLTQNTNLPGNNASLTIYLRLHLQKMTAKDPKPVDGNEKSWPHRDWGAGEFEQFRADVKKSCEDFWGKTNFCLVPPDDYQGLDWPPDKPTMRPNVECQFEIVWPTGGGDSHASIQCYRLDADSEPGFRSFVQDQTGSTNTGAWTNFDTVKRCGMSCGVDVRTGWADESQIVPIIERLSLEQVVVVHEVGHLLGLPHPGVFRKTKACLEAVAKGDSGAPSCYKGNDAYDEANVMGHGMRLDVWNGMPWWRRMSEHTGTTLYGWRVARTSRQPQKLPVGNVATAAASAAPPLRYGASR